MDTRRHQHATSRAAAAMTVMVGLTACGTTSPEVSTDDALRTDESETATHLGRPTPTSGAVPSEFEPTWPPTSDPEPEPETASPIPRVTEPPEPSNPEPSDRESTPERTSEPARDDTMEAAAGESFTLREQQSAKVEDAEVTLVSASGPGEDCHDCPLQATVEITTGEATERLQFSFSGNMAPGQAEQARTATALGWTVRVDRVVDGEADLTLSRS